MSTKQFRFESPIRAILFYDFLIPILITIIFLLKMMQKIEIDSLDLVYISINFWGLHFCNPYGISLNFFLLLAKYLL